jgi:hypothetical protein
MRPRFNSRAKGIKGELEFCRWLQTNFGLDFLPERNLDQVRNGGSDIVQVEPFFFEVKRVENLDLYKAWSQVVFSAIDSARKKGTYREGDLFDNTDRVIPVVAFRVNKKTTWDFLIPSQFIGMEMGYIQLHESMFIRWMRTQLRESQYQAEQDA